MTTHRVLDAHGSFQVSGAPWSTINARGPLAARQDTARKAGVCCYAEQHLNASTSPKANYACVIMAPWASVRCVAWGRDYTRRAAQEFGIADGGIVREGRGTGNVGRMGTVPAILLEPGFISNPTFAQYIATGEMLDALARVLVQSITAYFAPGIVGLSVGHMYRGTGDKGAPVWQADDLVDPAFDQEGEIATLVVDAAQQMFEELR
jgi:hypothetical protein